MAHYIDKDALVAEIEKLMYTANLEADIASTGECFDEKVAEAKYQLCKHIISILNTLEVKDPYEQCIQYSSVKDGIEAHAETYSFNIESELFNQLTKEQQALWRKEIEQACISGGGAGYELAKDPRYKENLEMKEVDLEKELNDFLDNIVGVPDIFWHYDKQIEWAEDIAKHFFELGLKAKQE